MTMSGAAAFVSLIGCFLGLLWRAERRGRKSAQTIAELHRMAAEAAADAARAQGDAASLRAILDALPIPLWRRNRYGHLVDCNRCYADALGATRDAVIAKRRELFPAGDAGRPLVSAEAAPATAPALIDGGPRLLEPHEIVGADGDTIGFAIDRAEVETIKRALRRHVHAHSAVLETLSAAVAIFNSEQRLKFFNSSFAALWELDPAWLATTPSIGDILEHLHGTRRFPEYPDFRAFKQERFTQFATLTEERHELMHLPDGRTLQLAIAPHPLGGLIYVFEDVSDHLALECSYNTLAQVQRATLDNLFEGIAVYGGDGRLKLHNPAFLALWGLSESDVAGEPHIAAIIEKTRDLLDPGTDWPRIRDELIAQVTSPVLASSPLYRRDGSMLQVASVPLPDGEMLLTYLDVSDTARVEQALRERNEALEAVARLKAEFLANVSYELRTPLNTIIGFTEILHHEYFGPMNSSQQEYSSGILDSAQQLLALIDDITDLASMHPSHLELERGPVDIQRMLQAIVALTRVCANGKGLVIELRCPSQLGTIQADERRLKQALFNLVSNAIRFTPPGGVIRIEAEQRDGELCLSVADTARGLAAPAGRQRRASAQPQSGAGIGLSLVKSLIELHGGTIEIASAPKHGTIVTCRLPVDPGDQVGTTELEFAERERDRSDSRCEAVA